jgi:hypothetical protein
VGSGPTPNIRDHLVKGIVAREAAPLAYLKGRKWKIIIILTSYFNNFSFLYPARDAFPQESYGLAKALSLIKLRPIIRIKMDLLSWIFNVKEKNRKKEEILSRPTKTE